MDGEAACIDESTERRAEQETVAARLGRWVSWPTHPLFVGTPVSLYVGIRAFGGLSDPVLELIAWVGALGLLFPLGFIYALQRSGVVSDFFLTRHEDRKWFYPVGLVTLLMIYTVFALYGAPPKILAVVAAGIVSAAAMALANRYLKVSLHAAGNAGIATALCWVEGAHFWPIWFLVAAACWGRLACREHQPVEIATGLILGTVPTVIAMGWFLGGMHW